MHTSIKTMIFLPSILLTSNVLGQESAENSEAVVEKEVIQSAKSASQQRADVDSATCTQVFYSSIKSEEEKSAKEACYTIDLLYSGLGIDDVYKELFLDIMRPISRQKQLDSDAVWKASRSIMRMFDSMNKPKGMSDDDFQKFKESVRQRSNDLLKSSYTDRFHRNENLSYQVSTRLASLVQDAVKIASQDSSKGYDSVLYAEDFQKEFEIFTDRYVGSARFSAGIGFSMNYIPRIIYHETTRIGFDTLQSVVSGGADRLTYTGIFENDNYIAPSIVLGTPYFKVNAVFPDYSDETMVTIPVNQREIAGIQGDVFYQTQVTSSLDIDYDINIMVSIRDYMLLWFDYKPLLQQFDYGIGYGALGVKVKSAFDTDIRVRTEGTDSFSNLTTTMILSGSEDHSYMIGYIKGYADFVFADTWVGGISVKYYHDDSNNGNRINVDGYTVSLEFHWFPTIIN